MIETVTITDILMKRHVSYSIDSYADQPLRIRIVDESIDAGCLKELLANGLKSVETLADMLYLNFDNTKS